MVHTLLIAESELELVPKELRNHPIVLARARRTGKDPAKMILQSTDLHKAMEEIGLAEAERRGRPDLIHLAVTIATDAPAFQDGRMEIALHLRGDRIIRISPGTRPPKEYSRFLGLMEQLLATGGTPLMKLENGTLEEFVRKEGKETIVFDSGETPTDVAALTALLENGGDKLLVVGGFPHGKFHNRPEGTIITVSGRELLAASVIGFISAALGDRSVSEGPEPKQQEKVSDGG
jgi:rRNA small subunit pseudouridine methyltransferase Nep1